MQTIKIVISDGKAKSVEISEMKKPTTTKDIEKMLMAMPKETAVAGVEKEDASCD